MTRKEKKLVALFKEFKEFSDIKDKDLVKILHTASSQFENMSPFSWQEHYGERKIKQKLLKKFTQNEKNKKTYA